jgi:hypothetical protein
MKALLVMIGELVHEATRFNNPDGVSIYSRADE